MNASKYGSNKNNNNNYQTVTTDGNVIRCCSE